MIKKFHPSKRMGQNFLINKSIANQIVNFIDFNKHDCVVEIGPGKGALTQILTNKPIKVIAIELDKRLAEYIKNKLPNIKVINDDVLKINLEELILNHKNPILLSNLPYSISSPFIFQYLKLKNSIDFICMLQKEYVDRLISKPNSKQYGALSVVVQTYLNITKLMTVDRTNFDPKPEINSTVIMIKKKTKLVNEKYIDFVRTCFAAKRKTLINNLKTHFELQKIQDVLNQLGSGDKTRAQEISPNLFEKLFYKLNYEN
jgi:16S rRNA (adenine1518-N6/adenine1519-N6)-dimethyltransferase